MLIKECFCVFKTKILLFMMMHCSYHCDLSGHSLLLSRKVSEHIFLDRKRVLNRAIKYNYKFNHYIHSIKSGGAISRAQ